jgi:putative addiction module antidote
MKLKLRSIGTSTGVILPKQLLDRLKLKKDDVLFASETPEGYLLTPYDPEVEKQVKLGLQIMKERRETLRALAK